MVKTRRQLERDAKKSKAAKARRPPRARTVRREMQRAIMKAQRKVEKQELRAKEEAK